MLAVLITLTVPAAADPAWWSDPATSIWTGAPQNVENWAPLNLGQLKNVANQARRYMDSRLNKVGGAGAAVTAMCQFPQTDNYAPATVGQLKNVARVFYDRLGQIGNNWQTGTFGYPSTPYPWSGTVNPENQAPCNIGQLKNLFAFEISSEFLALDADNDGIPSYWEFFYSLNPDSSDDSGEDWDTDGLSNYLEFVAGGLPNSADSDGDGATDLEEYYEGTNLQSDESTPLSLCYLARSVHWSVISLPPDPPNQNEANHPFWFDGRTYWTDRELATNSTQGFANCYFGRDVLGIGAYSGGDGGPLTGELPALSLQNPVPPTKNIPFGIVGGVLAQSNASFRSDGEGGASAESISVWIRGGKRPANTKYLMRMTTIRQGPPPLAPVEEISFESITLPKNSNSSGTQSYTAQLSMTHPRRSYSESTSIGLELLPVEVRAFQDANGPHGSLPMYAPPQPSDGLPFGYLLSAWPNEKITFGIGEPIAGMIGRNEFSPGYVQWTGDDLVTTNDVNIFEGQWATTGLKQVSLQIGTEIFRLYVNVPATGTLDFKKDYWQDAPLRDVIGSLEYLEIGLVGLQMEQRVNVRYGTDGGTGGTRQDAIRHSSWNAGGAAQVGAPKMITFSTANEFKGQYSDLGLASNTTMDLFNNSVGANVGHAYFLSGTNKPPEVLIDEMETKYNNGDLRAWTPPEATVYQHSNILEKSNRKPIFDP